MVPGHHLDTTRPGVSATFPRRALPAPPPPSPNPQANKDLAHYTTAAIIDASPGIRDSSDEMADYVMGNP
jgi:hypothetical protein